MTSLHLNSSMPPPRSRGVILKALLLLACVLALWQLRRTERSNVTGRGSNRALDDISFAQLLNSAVPSTAEAPHLILSAADSQWIDLATAAVQQSISTFNQQRMLQGDRTLQLIVLTADAGPRIKCRAKGWSCFGGFAKTAPNGMSGGTREWLKVAGLAEALATSRDVLFVDSDVSLLKDPLAVLAPLIPSADVLALDSPPGSLGTGLIWTRASNTTAAMWSSIRDQALASKIKVDDALNEILGTKERIARADGISADSFVSTNELEVHVLDPLRFQSRSLIYDKSEVDLTDAVSLQFTCAGDIQNRLFALKMHGAFPDLDSYYTSLHPVLKVDSLAGTREEVTQQFKILLVAAHYSGRLLEVPPTCHFPDIDRTRPIYSSFPVSRLSKAVGVPLVEPGYTSHAMMHLQSRESATHLTTAELGDEDPEEQVVLAEGEGAVPDIEAMGLEVEEENMEPAPDVALMAASELDLRNCDSLPDLLHRLISHAYRSEGVLTLTNFKSAPNWRRWSLPEALDEVTTCEDLGKTPSCSNICKRSSEGLKTVKWPKLSEVMVEPGE